MLLEVAIEVDEEIIRILFAPVDTGKPLFEQWPLLPDGQVGSEFLFQPIAVLEGILFCILIEKEIERVDDNHLGNEIDLDRERPGFFGKNQACEIVAERILLPVDEMLFRADLERVAVDRCPCMDSRPETHDMRRQTDRPVIAVLGFVIDRYADCHVVLPVGVRESSVGSGGLWPHCDWV